MIRRTCWCTKQKQNVGRLLHNNRAKFLKDLMSQEKSKTMIMQKFGGGVGGGKGVEEVYYGI